MLYNLFPVKIFKRNYPGNLVDLQTRIIPQLTKIFDESTAHNQASMRNGGICSVNVHNNIHSQIDLSAITTFVEQAATDYWKELDYVSATVKVNHAWANVYPPTAYIDIHNHIPAPIVASFYLKKPVDSGDLIFENPISTVLRYQPYKELNDPDGYVSAFDTTVEVSEGDVVLFPGWLMHKTQQNRSSENRIILGFNLLYEKNS